MSFGLVDGAYSHLLKHQPSFPHQQFAMAADGRRLEAYKAAIKTAIADIKKQKVQEEEQLLGGQDQGKNCLYAEPKVNAREAAQS